MAKFIIVEERVNKSKMFVRVFCEKEMFKTRQWVSIVE